MTGDRIKGVWLASHPIYYTKKGEANVKNEFKAGDLVFEVSFINGIGLTETTACGHPTYSIRGSSGVYTTNGLDYEDGKTPSLLPATPEIRQALVTLYGEDAVPELPLRGSELTKKLLEKQEYVLCFCSDTNDDDCRENKRPLLITSFEDGYFYEGKLDVRFVTTWKCAVPVDMNGVEITEIE